MINHTIVYNNHGKLIQFDAPCRYEHKTRKGLIKWANNEAFFHSFFKVGEIVMGDTVVMVDGNAI